LVTVTLARSSLASSDKLAIVIAAVVLAAWSSMLCLVRSSGGDTLADEHRIDGWDAECGVELLGYFDEEHVEADQFVLGEIETSNPSLKPNSLASWKNTGNFAL
jgi:hypothetical protein